MLPHARQTVRLLSIQSAKRATYTDTYQPISETQAALPQSSYRQTLGNGRARAGVRLACACVRCALETSAIFPGIWLASTTNRRVPTMSVSVSTANAPRQPSARPAPLPNAIAYRIDEVPRMGGPGRTKIYELAAQNKLRLVRVAGRTLVDGDSLRALLRDGCE